VTDALDLADRYVALWSEPDAERRHRAVSELWMGTCRGWRRSTRCHRFRSVCAASRAVDWWVTEDIARALNELLQVGENQW
jgi:hypothetical protein